MATAIRTIGHEDRLSLVDHLEELRTRLIVSGIVLAVAFGVCLWQNHALLHLISRPLERVRHSQVQRGEGSLGQAAEAQQAVIKVAGETAATVAILSAPTAGCRPRFAHGWPRELPRLRADTAKLPPGAQTRKARDAGSRRAVHDDDHGRLLLRADRLAAGDPVRALRLRAARAAADRETRRGAAADRGPVPVRGRRAVRLLRGAPLRAALPRELQQQRVQHPRSGRPVLSVRRDRAAGDGSAVPGPRGDPGRHPRRS